MKARILITLDVETNLDDDTIERRLEALIDPEEVAALLLEADDVLELQQTTFSVERDGTTTPPRLTTEEISALWHMISESDAAKWPTLAAGHAKLAQHMQDVRAEKLARKREALPELMAHAPPVEQLQKGDAVELYLAWAHGEDLAWFKGYSFDHYDGATAIVLHTDGPFAGSPVREPVERIRKARA